MNDYVVLISLLLFYTRRQLAPSTKR